MTDLVKWLRGWPAEVEEFGQCADEIERLREENEALEWLDGKGTEAAEIERLRQLLRDAGVPEWVINNE